MSGDDSDGSQKLRAVKFVRALRLLKIARVVRASRIFTRWQSSLSISWQKLQLTKLGLVIIVSGHWMGCAFGLIGSLQDQVRFVFQK